MILQPDGDKRLTGRNGAIWREFIQGCTQEFLADKYGLSQVRVSAIIKEVRATVPPADRGEMLQESLELIREVRRKAMELVEMAGAPVAVGKDGTVLYDPETGELVRDYSLRLKALDTAMKASDVEAKRLGLDSPIKLESSSRVAYTLAGVSVEDLQ